MQKPASTVRTHADTKAFTAVANPGWWDGLLVTDIVGCKYYQSSQTGEQGKLIETVTTGAVTFLSMCPWAWAIILHHPLGIVFGHRILSLWSLKVFLSLGLTLCACGLSGLALCFANSC